MLHSGFVSWISSVPACWGKSSILYWFSAVSCWLWAVGAIDCFTCRIPVPSKNAVAFESFIRKTVSLCLSLQVQHYQQRRLYCKFCVSTQRASSRNPSTVPSVFEFHLHYVPSLFSYPSTLRAQHWLNTTFSPCQTMNAHMNLLKSPSTASNTTSNMTLSGNTPTTSFFLLNQCLFPSLYFHIHIHIHYSS